LEKERKIWIREGDTSAEQRLAVAHGIAHLILHGGDHCCAWDEETPPEIEALGFSAELLVPFFMLRRYTPVAVRRCDPNPIPTLAEMFEAPEWVVRMQTRRLGYPWR
jgi:Zn-dependent peptidase ImmA (M78 family)